MKRFAVLLLGLGLIVSACGDNSQSDEKRIVSTYRVENNKLVRGEIVQVKFVEPNGPYDSSSDTLLHIVDANKQSQYLAVSGKLDVFEVGQTVEATYRIEMSFGVFDDGTREIYPYFTNKLGGSRYTNEPQYNKDGSISIVEIEWNFVDSIDILITP